MKDIWEIQKRLSRLLSVPTFNIFLIRKHDNVKKMDPEVLNCEYNCFINLFLACDIP